MLYILCILINMFANIDQQDEQDAAGRLLSTEELFDVFEDDIAVARVEREAALTGEWAIEGTVGRPGEGRVQH